MMITNKLRRIVCAGLLTLTIAGGNVYAAEPATERPASTVQAAAQKSAQEDKALQARLKELEQDMQAIKSKNDIDVEGQMQALTRSLQDIRDEVEANSATQARIMELLDELQKRPIPPAADNYTSGYSGTAATSKFLVNPGYGDRVSYTQDAINSQGNSTMVFSYAPNQLYKIYCRRGYLTDIVFKKGEVISYVGGGDTAGWAVSNTTVDGTPHLFIKPVVEVSTTNLIVATNKRTYQIVLNASNWYNPIVSWGYEGDEFQEEAFAKQKEDRLVIGNTHAQDVTNFDYDYSISGSGEKPERVFSDGEQTFIQFKKANHKQSPLFIRAKGSKEMQLVNYKVKGNFYVVDKVFEMAQLRDGDNTLTIKHK